MLKMDATHGGNFQHSEECCEPGLGSKFPRKGYSQCSVSAEMNDFRLRYEFNMKILLTNPR